MSIVTNGRNSAGATAKPPGPRPPDDEYVEEPASAGASLMKSPAPPALTTAPPHPNGRAPHPVTPDRPPVDGDADGGAFRVVIRPRRRRRLTTVEAVLLTALGVLIVLVGTAAGYAVANRLPSEYAAHADVLYPLTEAQPTGFLRQDRVLSTQEVLMDSRTVLDPVAAQFGVKVDDLADAVQTEVVSDSEVIRVQLTDESRARARKMLTAVITQYLAVANNPQRTQLQTYLQAQLADVQDRIAAAREVKDSEGEISVLLQRQTSLQSQLDDDQLNAIAGGTPRLTVAPYVEHDRVSPNTLMAVGGGALAGLVVALVTVAVLGRRMTRP